MHSENWVGNKDTVAFQSSKRFLLYWQWLKGTEYISSIINYKECDFTIRGLNQRSSTFCYLRPISDCQKNPEEHLFKKLIITWSERPQHFQLSITACHYNSKYIVVAQCAGLSPTSLSLFQKPFCASVSEGTWATCGCSLNCSLARTHLFILTCFHLCYLWLYEN